MGRRLDLQIGFDPAHQVTLVDGPSHACHWQVLITATHVETPSHAHCRQVLRMVAPIEDTSHARCWWIERGATVMGCEAV